MGGNSDTPDDPDFSGPEKGWEKSYKDANKRADKQYDWAKKQNQKNWDITKPIIENMTTMMNDQTANASEDRALYEDIFLPYTMQIMETDIPGYQAKVDEFSAEVDKLKQDALAYGADENKSLLMGQSVASVSEAFDKSKEGVISTLESYGINPGATRYASLSYSLEAEKAKAQAAAGTQAGLDVDETSRAMFNEALTREAEARGLDLGVIGLKTDMSNLGQAINTQALNETQLSSDLGTAATNAQLATSDLANKQRLSANDYMKTLNDSLAGWTDTIDKSYDDAMAQYTAEQEASSGIGSIVGAIAPVVPKLFAASGGEVPTTASPSRGAIEDDVNTMLTPGEFVFPVHAVQHYGTDRLQKMIDKLKSPATTQAEPAIPETTSNFPPLNTPATAVPPVGTNFNLI